MIKKVLLAVIMISVSLSATSAEKLLDTEEKIIESYVSLIEEVSSHIVTIKDMKSAEAAFEKINKLQKKKDRILNSMKKLNLDIDFGGLDDKENKNDDIRERMIKCQQKVMKVLMANRKNKELMKYIDDSMRQFYKEFDK